MSCKLSCRASSRSSRQKRCTVPAWYFLPTRILPPALQWCLSCFSYQPLQLPHSHPVIHMLSSFWLNSTTFVRSPRSSLVLVHQQAITDVQEKRETRVEDTTRMKPRSRAGAAFGLERLTLFRYFCSYQGDSFILSPRLLREDAWFLRGLDWVLKNTTRAIAHS